MRRKKLTKPFVGIKLKLKIKIMNPDHIKIMREKMEKYFSTVTPEQFAEDLKKADFDFYNSLPDSPVVHDPNVKIYDYKDENRFWWRIVVGSCTEDVVTSGAGMGVYKFTCYSYPVTIYRDNVKVFFDDFESDDQFYIPKVDEIMTRYVQYVVSVGIGFSYYTKDKK